MLSDSLIASSVEVNFLSEEDNPHVIVVGLDEVKKAIRSTEKIKGSPLGNCLISVQEAKLDVVTFVPFSLIKGLEIFLDSANIKASLVRGGIVSALITEKSLVHFYSGEYNFMDNTLRVYPKFNERKFLLHLKELTDQAR